MCSLSRILLCPFVLQIKLTFFSACTRQVAFIGCQYVITFKPMYCKGSQINKVFQNIHCCQLVCYLSGITVDSCLGVNVRKLDSANSFRRILALDRQCVWNTVKEVIFLHYTGIQLPGFYWIVSHSSCGDGTPLSDSLPVYSVSAGWIQINCLAKKSHNTRRRNTK